MAKSYFDVLDRYNSVGSFFRDDSWNSHFE